MLISLSSAIYSGDAKYDLSVPSRPGLIGVVAVDLFINSLTDLVHPIPSLRWQSSGLPRTEA